MRKDYWLPAAPVLVVDVNAVFGLDCVHWWVSIVVVTPGTCGLTVLRLSWPRSHAWHGIPRFRLGLFRGTSCDLPPLDVLASTANRPSEREGFEPGSSHDLARL